MLGSAGFVDADAPQVRLNASALRRTNDIDAATKSHPPPGKGLTVRGQEELFACRWLAEQVLRHHDSTITPDTRTGVSISRFAVGNHLAELRASAPLRPALYLREFDPLHDDFMDFAALLECGPAGRFMDRVGQIARREGRPSNTRAKYKIIHQDVSVAL